MRMIKSTLGIAAALALTAFVYLFVPPPSGLRAFEAQSTWGGTGGGSANAQTVAIANVQTLSDVLGVPLRYIPSADNTGPATIVINGLTATAVRRPSNIGLVALSGGELQAGVTMTVMYNGSTIEIQGPVDLTPIGRTVEFRGSVTPRGSLIEDGSCVSRTTYAPLFSVVGTNYGACDGTTTFGLPFSNGRAFVALDNQGAATANKITTAGSGCDGTVVGNCGFQNHIQTLLETPTGITAAGATANTIPGGKSIATYLAPSPTQVSPGSGLGVPYDTGGPSNITFLPTLSGTATTTVNNTGGQAHPILNPISLGRRAIKY
jgi:microcystin-dependent protein